VPGDGTMLRDDASVASNARTIERKKKGSHLHATPWFMWWAILGSNQ
jgi:hypothetical protein